MQIPRVQKQIGRSIGMGQSVSKVLTFGTLWPMPEEKEKKEEERRKKEGRRKKGALLH